MIAAMLRWLRASPLERELDRLLSRAQRPIVVHGSLLIAMAALLFLASVLGGVLIGCCS